MVIINSFKLAQRQVRLVVLTIVFFLVSILLIPLPGRSLYAQTATTGALSGTVRDPSGAFVSGAMVKIVNLGSGEERNLVTDEKGGYAVGFLPPGPYRIEISQAGFKTVVREPVTVRVTERAVADALLDVAQQRESVTVTSEAEILQTGTTALGRVVDSQLIT
jgi:Carboxypeptidase regulatory-like domain